MRNLGRIGYVVAVAALWLLSCKSGGSGSSEPAVPEGCPVRGDTVDLKTTPGALFVKDIRFFTAIGDDPMVTAPAGKVYAVVRYVWTPAVPELPPAAAKAAGAEPGKAAPAEEATQGAPTGEAAKGSTVREAPQDAPTAAATKELASPTQPIDPLALPSAPIKPQEAMVQPPSGEVIPPPLQLVDRSGIPFPSDQEAIAAYQAMTDSDPNASRLPTEFTGIWLMDPAQGADGLFLLTAEKAEDGTPVRFCMGRHKIEVE